MSTEAGAEMSFFEKLSEKFSSFAEWVGRVLLRWFGSSNERFIESLGYIRPKKVTDTYTVEPGSLLAQVNELEPRMQALSPEELRGLTPKFRERLAQGEKLDALLPEAFAACREAAFRTKNMRHFDVQIVGGIVLHRGNIAEMATGEGKTLVATLPAYLNALTGQGVHVITVNDYLARRDCEWMLPIYKALGVTAGFIQSDMEAPERRRAYDCDITYGTNSEFGFDYLRDNMKPARWGDPSYPPQYHQCQRGLNFAIIDEVDNILIDEARTPLIISGMAYSDVRRYGKANEIAVKLTELQTAGGGPFYEVKEKEHTCHLTDEGIHKAEELAGVESFYTAGNMEWPHLIDNALKAHHLYRRDKHYAVMRDPENGVMSIIIIDEFTGRLMHGRQWSDGLHQAVEAKHAKDGVKIKEETQTLATITLQNYFKLYKKLAGMTGTAMTEANEFWKIYKLDVISVPTNKPLRRVNHPDLIFRTARERWTAVIEEIAEVHQSGRPVLIGTTDVDKSIKLSEMLRRRGIQHELLNALPEHAGREAEIIAQAGRIGAVTLSTNMAGRGTDIILGGNPETLAWAILKNKYPTRLDVPEDEWKATVESIETREKMKEEGRRVAEMGGLHVIGTERHDARRIDNQLKGRAGRQGDPGSSRFYLSLEDDLMRIFGGEWVKNWLTRLGMQEGEAIENRFVSRRIEGAQKKVEERHFDSRKHLLEYDEVMDTQRKYVYGYRQRILDGTNCKMLILDMIDSQITLAVARFLDADYGPETFAEFASKMLNVEFEASSFSREDYATSDKTAHDKAYRTVPSLVQEIVEENLGGDDPREWNWQALSNQANSRWGLKTTDRSLKQMGKDALVEYLIAEGQKNVTDVDLSAGRPYLESDWGLRSLCEWAHAKFQIKVTVEELTGKSASAIEELLHVRVMEKYRQKEIEFPVQVGVSRFIPDKSAGFGAGQRSDREGFYRWAIQRFPLAAAEFTEEWCKEAARHTLAERLLDISRRSMPETSQEVIDGQLDAVLEGAPKTEPAHAGKLAAWMKTAFDVTVAEGDLTGVSRDKAREVLWNAYDLRYRPEMRTMERSLLLGQLDTAWKNHLHTMDHLRSGIGLVGYAQVDPKTEYKRQGMKEFEAMKEGVQDRVTDAIFRMEEAEGFQEALWTITATQHDVAPRALPKSQQEDMITSGSEGKKKEPIRRAGGPRVGRNDPCPCGSGKKYKNCTCGLRSAAG